MQAKYDPVLVTGSSGFVGACAVRQLVERGHQVHILLRPTSNPWRLIEIQDRLSIHEADLSDAEAIASLLADVRPQTILHLATHGAYENQADARAILRTNTLGTYNLLEAAVGCGAKLFVNTGSSSEYGFKSEPMSEMDRLDPNSFYSVGKAAQTHLCQVFAQQTDLRVVTFRLFSVYGPWEAPTRLVPTILQRAHAGLPLDMVSPETVRDFVYVDDVLDALLNFPRLIKLKNEILNLGTGIETTLRSFIMTVMKVTQRPLEVRWGAMPARKWDTNRWVSDPAKAQKLLNWQRKHTLEQGLAKTSDWLQKVKGESGGTRSLNR